MGDTQVMDVYGQLNRKHDDNPVLGCVIFRQTQIRVG